MTLKVSSWHKICDAEWIPNCVANDILNVIIKNENYMKLVSDDEMTLGYAGNILTGHTHVIVWNQNMVGQQKTIFTT